MCFHSTATSTKPSRTVHNSKISLHFNYFKNSIAQLPASVQVFPFSQETFDHFIEDIELNYEISLDTGNKDIQVEPSAGEFAAELRRQIRNYVIASAIVQNKTGEHAARMIAMKNATDNSNEFVKSLKLSFNKARQGAITQEISEIVSAKIAIGG